jgi:hypothetical protein
MARRIRGRTGAGERRARPAGKVGQSACRCTADIPVRARSRLQAIALGAGPFRSAKRGGGLGNFGVKFDLTGQADRA